MKLGGERATRACQARISTPRPPQPADLPQQRRLLTHHVTRRDPVRPAQPTYSGTFSASQLRNPGRMGPRDVGGPAAVLHRRHLPQLPQRRRRRGPCASRFGSELRPPGGGKGALGSGEPLPDQQEHPAADGRGAVGAPKGRLLHHTGTGRFHPQSVAELCRPVNRERAPQKPGCRCSSPHECCWKPAADRRLLLCPRALLLVNIRGYADLAKHEASESILRGHSSWDGSWSEPQRTGGHRRHRRANRKTR